jgi:monoamine oxidase
VAVDLGGACIGATHWRAKALIDELGLSTRPAYDGGERMPANVWRGHPAAARVRRRLHRLDLTLARRQIDALTATAAAASPATDGAAESLDNRLLGPWLDSIGRSPRARASLRDILANLLSADLDSTSLLHAAFYLRAGGGLTTLIAKAGGAQQDLVAGGSHSIPARLAERLGDAVVLGAPVHRIAQGASGVLVEAGAVAVEAEAAIVAVPPSLAAAIDYAPALEPARDGLMRSMRTGDSLKAAVVYDHAFWRDEGRDGETWGGELPFSFTHDVSGDNGLPGVLSVFFAGGRAAAARALSAGDRRSCVLEALEGCFGPQAAHPVGYMERDWTAEDWSRGGYGTSMPPGAWTRYGAALQEPAGRIHWAGTESSTEHHGYIEGAVRAGERAAAEALVRQEDRARVA